MVEPLNPMNSQSHKSSFSQEPPPVDSSNSQLQQELNRLEEMILESPRIPFTDRTLVQEKQILAQLDLIRAVAVG